MSQTTHTDDSTHPLEGVFVYEDQTDLIESGRRPAAMFHDGSLASYDLHAARDAGYELYKVVYDTAHNKGPTPLYVFEEA